MERTTEVESGPTSSEDIPEKDLRELWKALIQENAQLSIFLFESKDPDGEGHDQQEVAKAKATLKANRKQIAGIQRTIVVDDDQSEYEGDVANAQKRHDFAYDNQRGRIPYVSEEPWKDRETSDGKFAQMKTEYELRLAAQESQHKAELQTKDIEYLQAKLRQLTLNTYDVSVPATESLCVTYSTPNKFDVEKQRVQDWIQSVNIYMSMTDMPE